MNMKTKYRITIELSSTETKTRTTETHELTASEKPNLARAIVRTWLDRCKDGEWTETTRQCLEEFASGLGPNWGTSASSRAISAARDLADDAEEVTA